MASGSNTDFVVWGIDQTAYGPVELPTLVSWVKDERVTADTWIFAARTASWQKDHSFPSFRCSFIPNQMAPRGRYQSRLWKEWMRGRFGASKFSAE